MKKALLSLLLTIAIMPLALGQRPATATFETTDTTACGSFKWTNDSVYTASTVDTYTSGDTVYVLNLTLEPPQVDTVNAIPVSGGCYAMYNEKKWTVAGTFTDTLRVAGQSCDKLVKIEVTLSGQDTIESEVATACDHYATSWGDTLTASASGTNVPFTTASCTVLVQELNVTINSSLTTATEQIAHEGCSYDWNGILVEVSDSIYRDTTTLANGCDSITSIQVTLSNRSYDTTQIVACDKYVLDGTDITSDTTIVTIDSTTACHAYSVLQISIRNTFKDTASTVIRDTVGGCSLEWMGDTYTLDDVNTPLYAMGTTTAGNCDSLMAIRITAFNGTQHDTLEVEQCGYYRWHGDTLRLSGEYSHVDTVAATATSPACLKTTHLFFTRTPNHDERTPATVCEKYTFRFNSRQGTGNQETAIFTTAGTYVTDMNGDTLYSTNRNDECRTYYTLHLDILPVTQRGTSVVDTTVCDKYTHRFNGVRNFTRSIDTIFVMESRGNTAKACYDSTNHLILTVKKKSYANYDTTACDAYTWVGYTNKTYTRSTVDSLKLSNVKNAAGCDSVGRLNLTINHTSTVVIEGDSNLQPDANGQGTARLQAVSEDSIVAYAWYVGNETTPASTEPTFERTVNTNTNIRLESTNAEQCVSSNWITITVNVGIDESEAAQVNLYPNPAARFLNVPKSPSTMP